MKLFDRLLCVCVTHNNNCHELDKSLHRDPVAHTEMQQLFSSSQVL